MSIAAHAETPEGSGIPRLTLPRTLKAVRAELNDAERAQLAAELETGIVPEVFERWWDIAAVRSSRHVAAAVARYHSGQSRAVPIEEAAAALLRRTA